MNYFEALRLTTVIQKVKAKKTDLKEQFLDGAVLLIFKQTGKHTSPALAGRFFTTSAIWEAKFKRHVYKLNSKSDTSLKLCNRNHLHAPLPTMNCDAMGQKQIIGMRN